MWDINQRSMQSNCKVYRVVLLASLFVVALYLLYQFNSNLKKENKKMSYRLMFIVNAVTLAIFGFLFITMPSFVLNQFKSEVYVATLYAARFMGGTLLISGLLIWFMQDLPIKKQKVIAYLLLASSIGGFILSLLGMTSIGVLRENGWVLLVIFGVFSLIYGYMLFLQPKQPKPVEAKPRAPRKPKEVPFTNNGQVG
jgi:hypothetical protein